MSQRGVLNLFHFGRVRAMRRRGAATRLFVQGDDAVLLDQNADVRRLAALSRFRPNPRFPIYGGLYAHLGAAPRGMTLSLGASRAAPTGAVLT